MDLNFETWLEICGYWLSCLGLIWPSDLPGKYWLEVCSCWLSWGGFIWPGTAPYVKQWLIGSVKIQVKFKKILESFRLISKNLIYTWLEIWTYWLSCLGLIWPSDRPGRYWLDCWGCWLSWRGFIEPETVP